jgi:nitrogen fixation protein FixH
MLQSLLALPLSAVLEVLLFLGLYRLTPLSGKQAAVVVALVSLTALLLFSLVNWPGADVLAMYVAVLGVTAYLLGIVSHSYAGRRAATAGRRRWFHWGPAAIVGFFLLLFALDSVLVTVSRHGLPPRLAQLLLPGSGAAQLRSVFPGTVASDFQKKEAHFNAHLEQVKRQEERGWQIAKGWLGTPVQNAPAVFQVQVHEANGAPLRSAGVSGAFLRPSDSRRDTSFRMQEVEPGLYRTQLTLPEAGLWNLVLSVRKGEQLHELRARTRVLAAGP